MRGVARTRDDRPPRHELRATFIAPDRPIRSPRLSSFPIDPRPFHSTHTERIACASSSHRHFSFVKANFLIGEGDFGFLIACGPTVRESGSTSWSWLFSRNDRFSSDEGRDLTYEWGYVDAIGRWFVKRIRENYRYFLHFSII